VGAFFVVIGIVGLMDGLASRGWDAVSGKIIESRFSLARSRRVYWVVEIRYRYTVEGLTYESDRVGFWKGRRFWSPGAAERLVTMYPKGRIVTLFVSPSSLSRCHRARGRLERGDAISFGWRVGCLWYCLAPPLRYHCRERDRLLPNKRLKLTARVD